MITGWYFVGFFSAIENEKGGKKNGHGVEDDLVNVVPSQPARVSCRVRVPEKEHPKVRIV